MKSIYQVLVELEGNVQPAVLCTIVTSQGSTPRHVGSKMIVYQDGHIFGSVGGGELESRVITTALEAIKDGKPRLLAYNLVDPQGGDPGVCGGQVEVFVEPILPKPTLVVVGAGHVGKAVAHLAHWLGYHVVVNDDRPELCSPESVPDADEYIPVPLAQLPQHINITSWTYLVLTTRNVTIDVPGLPALLASPAAYIGVIGSRRRWATALAMLRDMGVTEEQLARVHSPIGLEIQAETPEEIAISIMAEIIKERRQNVA